MIDVIIIKMDVAETDLEKLIHNAIEKDKVIELN